MTPTRRRRLIRAARARLLPIEIDGTPALVLQLCALCDAVQRGLDYVALPDQVTVGGLSLVEKALALHTWGLLFIVAGSVGLAGIALRRWPLTLTAHAALTGIYLAFGLGALADILARGDTYGWRTGAGWLLGSAVAHAVLAEGSLDAIRPRRD